jgi:hypothetical protein
MSAVAALIAACAAGVHLEVDGSDLLLEAASAPPASVLDALASYKPDIVALLRPMTDSWTTEDWQAFYEERAGTLEFDAGMPRPAAEAQAFEACVTEWLNRDPASSSAGSCSWCGGRETDSAAVVPFGTEPGSHAWLRSECWRPWQDDRRAEAVKALHRIVPDPKQGGRS